uniref:Uncharacterized protein n=1 Tax=Paramoeba aestuarina TaxID=180227 RepID=A0A7S4L324_9EUKA|mmetsp:Transcript_30633/g.47671  ORF Transcript_30633/g.47671 Transcript_30633/m.47671 type:complete len:101 (+) Transcript_30633:69-371(+)
MPPFAIGLANKNFVDYYNALGGLPTLSSLEDADCQFNVYWSGEVQETCFSCQSLEFQQVSGIKSTFDVACDATLTVSEISSVTARNMGSLAFYQSTVASN